MGRPTPSLTRSASRSGPSRRPFRSAIGARRSGRRRLPRLAGFGVGDLAGSELDDFEEWTLPPEIFREPAVGQERAAAAVASPAASASASASVSAPASAATSSLLDSLPLRRGGAPTSVRAVSATGPNHNGGRGGLNLAAPFDDNRWTVRGGSLGWAGRSPG